MNVAISPRQFWPPLPLFVVPESAMPVLETIFSRTAKEMLTLKAPSIKLKPLVGLPWPPLLNISIAPNHNSLG